MGSAAAIVIILGFVAIALAIVYRVALQRRRAEQKQALEQLATSKGWQFIAEDDSYAKRWQGKPFTSNRGRGRNVIIGQHRGRNFCAFEYSYTTTTSTGQGTTSQIHYFSVWVIALPAQVPDFSVGAEGVFGGKVAEALGFERVEVSDQEFNSTFKVKSDDSSFGTLVLQPDLVDLLKSTGPWDWRFNGQDMISYQSGNLEVSGLQPRLDLMCDVLDRIPQDAWRRARR
jgi:hypothetical protein